MEARVGIEPAYTELQGVYLNTTFSISISALHNKNTLTKQRIKGIYRANALLINQYLRKSAALICAVFGARYRPNMLQT